MTVKGTQALTAAERYGLIGVAVVGIGMMLVAARVYRAPIFKAKLETAESTSADVRMGAE